MLTSPIKGKRVKRVKKDKKDQRDKKVAKAARDPKGTPLLLSCMEAKLLLKEALNNCLISSHLYLSADPVGHSTPPDLLSHSRCPGCHSGTHGKGSDTFPWIMVAQLVIPALSIPSPFSLRYGTPPLACPFFFMAIAILDSHSIPTLFQSFGLSPSYTHLPCLATALAVIPAPTVGARHALCFLTFFFLAPSSPLSRTYTLFLWHLSSPHSCAPTTLLRPPSLSVSVLLSLVLCTHILSSPTLLLRAPPGCHGDPK